MTTQALAETLAPATVRGGGVTDASEISPRRERVGLALASAVGVGMLGLWAYWWVASVQRGHLVEGQQFWVSSLPVLAGDFVAHIDHTARVMGLGMDPYNLSDPFCALFPYPPAMIWMFLWVNFLTPATAEAVWIATLNGLIALAAWGAWRTRRRLGLRPLPLSLLVALLFFCTPTIVCVERGQCDPIVLPVVLSAAALLRYRGRLRSYTAGSLLGIIAWIKYYPAFALVGLVAARRYRAAVAMVLVAGSIGAADVRGVRRALENGASIYQKGLETDQGCSLLQHALAKTWPTLWEKSFAEPLRAIPGQLVAALLLMPVVGWVAWKVRQSEHGDRVLGPFLLWMIAAATFAMPYSHDYNFLAMPLLVLSLWNRDDSVPVHMTMTLFLLYWQPLGLIIDARILFGVKVATLYALGGLVVRHARGVPSASSFSRTASTPRPHFAPY